VPLKGRCEIIDVSLCQESNILEVPKPNLLHFSEATNEITPSASICELAVGKSGVPKHSQEKTVPRESGKSTQQRVVFPNACDFPVHVTGTPVELGGRECHSL
jgi:hypothetical protein